MTDTQAALARLKEGLPPGRLDLNSCEVEDVRHIIEVLEGLASKTKRFLKTTDPFLPERGTGAELDARQELVAEVRKVTALDALTNGGGS